MPGQMVDTSPSRHYYVAAVAGIAPAWSAAYAFVDAVSVPFVSTGIMLENISAADISYSFDGATVQGVLSGDQRKWFDNFEASRIYFRSVAGGQTIKVTAWSE